jgi:hypothetical protein
VIRFLVVLVRVLVGLFLVRLVLRAIAGALRPPSERAAAPPAAGVDMVRDNVCNTFLPRERALRAVLAGREEHFCSAECRDRALAAVSRAS